MAEVLLQWVDKVAVVDPLYAHNYRAGDVIAVCPDGWAWSQLELTNPAWRVVKLPNVTVEQCAELTRATFDATTGKLDKRRGIYIDGTKIPPNVYGQIDRAQVFTSQIAYTTLAAWLANH